MLTKLAHLRQPRSTTHQMKNITLLDDSFNINNSRNYQISVQISEDGYSFAILDPAQKKYLVLKHQNFDTRLDEQAFSKKTKDLSKNDNFLGKKYLAAKVCYITNKFTYVPEEFYTAEAAKQHIEANHNMRATDIIEPNYLPCAHAYCLFGFPSDLSTLLANHFDDLKIYHQTTPLVEYLLSPDVVAANKNKLTRIYINVHISSFDICIIDVDRLVMVNSFAYPNTNDFVFFVLHTFEQLQLNTDLNEVVLLGNIDVASPSYASLKKFVKNISFMKLSTDFKYTTHINEVPEQSFVNLFNLNQCE